MYGTYFLHLWHSLFSALCTVMQTSQNQCNPLWVSVSVTSLDFQQKHRVVQQYTSDKDRQLNNIKDHSSFDTALNTKPPTLPQQNPQYYY